MRDDGSLPAEATLIPVDGRWVLPGFHDPHLHLISLARSLTASDLPSSIRTAEMLSTVLRERSRTLGPRVWLDALRFDHHRMTQGWIPDRAALDRAVGQRPTRLRHRNQRIDVLNSVALAACGLLSGDLPDGVETDAGGNPTGRLYNCGSLIRARRPPGWDGRQLGDAVALASQMLFEQGVTSIQDATAHNGDPELQLLDRLAGDHIVKQRLWSMASGERLADGAVSGEALIRTRHAKLVAIESQLDPDALIQQAMSARQHGLAVAIHATSETELGAAVAVIDTVRGQPLSSGARDRIEHGFVASDAAVASVAESGAAVVINPALIAEAGDTYRREFGPELHGLLHRAASWQRAGTSVSIASDAPVTRSSAIATLKTATTRLTPDGQCLGATERLSAHEALASMTAAPADLIGEKALGSLTAGSVADLIVTSGAGPFGSIVDATFLDGELVFDRRELTESKRRLPPATAGKA